MSDVTVTTPTPPPPPAQTEDQGTPTSFTGLELKAVRDATAGRWYLYTELNGIKWILSERKLGGLDDDLQELATPGFREARALRYASEFGRPRTEPGPGA